MSVIFEVMLDPDPAQMGDLLCSLHPILHRLPPHEITEIASTTMRLMLSAVAQALRAPDEEQQHWLVEYTGR